MGNPFGRTTIVPLTNKSGGGVVAGDVVIVDTANNDAFTTTTSAAFTGAIGIAQQTIGSNAVGLVAIAGYVSLVNVNASVTRGHFGATHTVAKQAADFGASRGTGSFCIFLTGGTTPDAMLWGSADLGAGSGMTNPMTTTGDMIYSSSGSTPARLAVGAAGTFLGGGSTPAYAQVPGQILATKLNTVGSYDTITATTMADVDATNAAVTFTAPASTNVLVRVSCVVSADAGGGTGGAAGDIIYIGLREGASDIAGAAIAHRLVIATNTSGVNDYKPVSLAFLLTGLSGGSHTYKVSAKVTDGTRQRGFVSAIASEPMVLEVVALA